jgi:hypothetical protein
MELSMRNTTLVAIMIATFAMGGVFFNIFRNIWSKDYITVEIDTLDRIIIETRIGSSNPKQLFTYGKTSTVFKEHKGRYDVIISVRKITDNDNPINVTIIDKDSKILFTHIFLRTQININLDEIIQTRAIKY